MFGWLKSRTGRRKVTQVRVIRAKYDAAQTTPDNRRHWANADLLSADAAANPEVRRKLRSRSRYEVANNCYAQGIVLTLANDVIGTGPRLQMLTDADETNRRIEREFTRWAKAVRLAEKLRTMRKARATDGEAFALLFNNGWRATAATLKGGSVEFEMVWDTNDTGFTAIQEAYFGNTPIEFAVMDGDIAVPGTQGLRATMSIINFSRNEPLEEAVTVSVTAKPTYADHAPEWMEIAV